MVICSGLAGQGFRVLTQLQQSNILWTLYKYYHQNIAKYIVTRISATDVFKCNQTQLFHFYIAIEIRIY